MPPQPHHRSPNGKQSHCGFMPANLITLPHFSASSAMSLPKSAGEPASVIAPKSTSGTFSVESARPALISPLSRSTIARGVFFGTTCASASERASVPTAGARNLPALIDVGMVSKPSCTCPARRR
jgi:hypothetical protein